MTADVNMLGVRSSARPSGLRGRGFAVAILFFFAWGCVSTAPKPQPKPEDRLSGVASWYGEEFAGRTTANGEIFDPQRLTAAHRTLPFGTLLDVTNRKTGKTVRVRINDRGPFIENRMIDLSWAAAREIGLVEAGIGEVEVRLVKLGAGEREPPEPYDVQIAGSPRVAAPPDAAPDVPFPVPPPAGEVVVDSVVVEESRGGSRVRKRVAADGTSFETVPVEEPLTGGDAPAPAREKASPAPLVADDRRTVRMAPGFYVQVGAFAGEANARALAEKVAALGQRAWVQSGDLHRVRIGPFRTREEAIDTRRQLEANGLSAIIVVE